MFIGEPKPSGGLTAAPPPPPTRCRLALSGQSAQAVAAGMQKALARGSAAGMLRGYSGGDCHRRTEIRRGRVGAETQAALRKCVARLRARCNDTNVNSHRPHRLDGVAAMPSEGANKREVQGALMSHGTSVLAVRSKAAAWLIAGFALRCTRTSTASAGRWAMPIGSVYCNAPPGSSAPAM